MLTSNPYSHFLVTGTLACLTSALISFIPLHSHPDKFRAGAPLGIIFVLCLVAFYASPLSTIVTAFKTRDSSSFYRPLVVMSVLSSCKFKVRGRVSWGSVINVFLLFFFSKLGLLRICLDGMVYYCSKFTRSLLRHWTSGGLYDSAD